MSSKGVWASQVRKPALAGAVDATTSILSVLTTAVEGALSLRYSQPVASVVAARAPAFMKLRRLRYRGSGVISLLGGESAGEVMRGSRKNLNGRLFEVRRGN